MGGAPTASAHGPGVTSAKTFRPSPPADLLRPRPGSTTTRALLSLARRTRFEAWKAYEPPPLPSDLAQDLATVRAALQRFLPGDPHAVVRVLVMPTVGADLRRVVGGALDPGGARLPPDPAALPSLCTSIALALAVDGALSAPLELAAPVAVTLLAADARLVPAGPVRFEPDGRCVGGTLVRGIARPTPLGAVATGSVDLARLERVRAAFARTHPGASETSVRLARELPSADEAPAWLPRAIGRLCCPTVLRHTAEALDDDGEVGEELEVREGSDRDTGDVDGDGVAHLDACVDELAREHARQLLAALSEVDPLADDPARLVDAALRFVTRGVADEAVRAALEGLSPSEAGAGLVAEILGD